MVTEPVQSTAQALVSGVSAAIVAWTGITYLSIFWSFIGVMAATVFITPQIKDSEGFRTKVFFTVFISTMVGAGLAELAHAFMMASGVINEKFANGAHLGIALLLGAGAKPCLVAGIKRMTNIFSGEKGI